MKRKALLVGLSFIITIGLFSKPVIYRGKKASAIVKNSTLVRINDRSPLPNFVRFSTANPLALSQFQPWIQQFFKNSNTKASFTLVKTTKDRIGFVHRKYQEKINGIPVQFGMVTTHAKGNKIYSFSGELYPATHNTTTPSLGKQAALQSALNHIGAQVYKWQIPSEENYIKKIEHNPNATYYPKGTLTYIYADNKPSKQLRLAYKFNIYASKPVSRTMVWVDAVTGKILYTENLLWGSNATGTAHTQYSGIQTITTNEVSSSEYTLEETGRDAGVTNEELNAQNSTNYGAAIDFTDADNNWNNVNAQDDQYATDAYWGQEKVIDFYWQKFSRNSIDGNGMTVVGYMHYPQGGGSNVNAFWDGSEMNYGDGGSDGMGDTYNPIVGLDVIGHEMTHGVTQNTADLTYENESGALNESFSDCFGNTIEHWAKPATASWDIGEGMGGAPFRNMANPNQYQQPDTYEGTDWYTGTQDNGGVHENSGVQNFWYYLMVEGGSGTNDNGDAYNVTGLGWDTAIDITYRSLTQYLSANSQYSDARFYAIQAATDLYGSCSQAVITTTNAWYAVGVGAQYSGSAVISNFAVSAASSCSLPAQIDFTNNSSGTSYYWNFGDGTTSTQTSPSHSYTSNGTYNVMLIATGTGGGCSGSDTSYQTVTINAPANPTVQNVSTCPNASATLTASGNGQINWYSDAGGTNLVGTGSTYTTPNLSSNTTYYVSNTIIHPVDSGGAMNTSIGAGQFYTNGNATLTFDVYSTMDLISVKVYAQSAVTKTFELLDAGGNVLQSEVVNVPASATNGYVVNLNFVIPPGTGYTLGVDGTYGDLYRNSAGATYPYALGSLGEITGNSFGTQAPAYYYMFYDWKVKAPDCSSSLVPVTVSVSGISATASSNGPLCAGSTLNLSASGGSSYSWSGPNGFTSNSQNPSISNVTANAAGTYTVTVSNGAGCSAQQTVQVAINVAPTASASSNNPICQGSTLNLNASGGSSYSWSGPNGFTSNSQNPSISNVTANAAGTYTVTVSNSSGCTAQQTVQVTVNPLPTASFNAIVNGGNITLTNNSSNGSSYYWNFGDGTTSTQTTPSHSYSASGGYTIMLVVSNNCGSDTAYQTVNVTVEGINNIVNNSNISILPNPFSSNIELGIDLQKSMKVKLSFFDLIGRKIYKSQSETLHAGKNVINLQKEFANSSEGVYMISITLNNGRVIMRKVVKMK